MTFADAAALVRLLLRQSDRHPIRALGAADLEAFDPLLVRSLRTRGILIEREDLRDDGGIVLQAVDEVIVEVDPETVDVERLADALEVRTWDIDFAALCHEIRARSGLEGPTPQPISARVWRLGRHRRQTRTAEICLVRCLREANAQEIVDHVRGAIDNETFVALVALGRHDLPTAVARQLEVLRMTYAAAEDLLLGDPTAPFAMDFGQIRLGSGAQRPVARLVVDRIGRRATFEGIELVVEPRDFGVLLLLADEAADAGGWVPSDSIAAALRAGSGREANPEQVDRSINRLRDVFRMQLRGLPVPRNGFIERKSKVGARLALAPSEIGAIA